MQINKSLETITRELTDHLRTMFATEKERDVYMEKLYGYMWTNKLYELMIGRFYRWMLIDKRKLTSGGVLTDVRFHPQGTILLFKSTFFKSRFQQVLFDKIALYQKMTQEDCLHAVATEYLTPSLTSPPNVCVPTLIGRGKFSRVYRTMYSSTNETVAMKCEDHPLLLKHEAQILFYLHRYGCTHIPAIYWFGEWEAKPTLIMSWMNEGLMTDPSKEHWICLLDVLQHIHSLNIVHRDIKPDNCMMRNGKVYLIDFGLAHIIADTDTDILSTDYIIGTPDTMSLFVEEGHMAQKRDDLISLGYTFCLLRGYTILDKRLWHQQHPMSYFDYCYSLEFRATPHYSFLQTVLSD
jgi:hypothetical protein